MSYIKPAGKTASAAGKTAKVAGKTAKVASSALKFAGKGIGVASKFAKILAPLEVLKDQFDFFSSKSMRKTGVGGWFESLGGSGMSLLDGLGGEYNPIKWATNWSGLSIKNMQTDNVANARAVYRSRYPSAPTVIPNSVLIKDIKKNPSAYPDDVVEDAEDAQAVDDGIAKPGRGPFTITDKFGKMAVTNARDGLAVSQNISQTGGGGTMRHEFGSLNISGNITVNIPGASSLTVELTKDETFRRHITRMVQEEAVKQLNQGKPKP
jgi:hypothetical protein